MSKNRRIFATLTAIAVASWLSACTEVRNESASIDDTTTDVQESETADPACVGCHGSDNSAAPPLDLKGRTDETARGVGAHAAHLVNNTLGHDVACDACHKVPATVDAPGHIDTASPAEVVFSGTAVADGAEPSLDASQGADAIVTCSSVYCHGATLAGGTLTAPAWNPPNPAASKCDACHGFPPPAPHPAYDRCDLCHAPVVSAEGTIADRTMHINGTVDVLMFAECNTCHGNDTNAAPPVDLKGLNDTAAPGVGAHQSHLKAGHSLASPVACEQCHKVPAKVDSTGHLDDGTPGAELAFGALATAGGTTIPAYDADARTCSNTYCHGVTLLGGNATAPVWTKVDDTQVTCDSCHGNPPAAPHPQRSQCGTCHPATAEGATIAHPEHHIDGKLDVAANLACNVCHGSDTNDAPPADTNGGTLTTLVTVGAHQAHLLASSALSSPVACDACHKVPASVDAVGHLGASPAEVTFGALAQAGGASPEWNHADATCSSTYCHGATLHGGALTAPIWTKVDDTQDVCGSCHGVPPPAPHVQLTDCGMCHDATAQGKTIAHPEKHVNGVVEVNTSLACNACHGSADNAAPPVDTVGGTATTLVTVGAHQSHVLGAGALSSPLQCTDCHVQPAAVTDAGHLDPAPAEVTFGALASAGGATPEWNRVDATCSSTYCHGATLSGGLDTTPVWTIVDGSQEACDSCHGAPPAAPHVQMDNCGLCHAATASGGTIAHPEKHIDGHLDVDLDLACNACHGSPDSAAPPVDTTGGSATTLVTVGAHQAHVQAVSGLSSPLECSTCHVQPATVGQAGHLDAPPAEITFSALVSSHGAQPEWDRASATCSSTYCHGATLTGGSNTAPDWTAVDGTQAACGSCHGVPPPAPHTQSSDCGLCHPDTAVGATIAHPEKHIDGVLDVLASPACNACHGSADNAAPPVDTTGGSATTLVTVGAHQAHVAPADGLAAPLDCSACHVKPASMGDTGHIDASPAELTFGALASTSGATPTWNRGTATCSSTYCHGATLDAGGTTTTPTWTQVDGSQKACGTCHGNPPPAPHAQIANCGLCHPATAEGGAIAHPEKHVDGTLDVSLASGCSACHGSDTNAAPPVDTTGGSATTLVTVGAHQAHLTAQSALSSALSCDQCHVFPASVDAIGHIDASPAEVAFGALASTGGATPAWDRVAATCSSTYCHGATLNAGGAITAPVWTKVDDTQDTCGSCHGNPPPAPHVQSTNCGLCHPATATGDAIAHPEKHIDGTLDVNLNQACNACHGNDTNAAPPLDTTGGSSTTLTTVGAHQAHLTAQSALSSPVACTTCHTVPATVGAAGHLDAAPAEVSMTGLAAAKGATPTWNRDTTTCSSTYCHGATLNAGGTLTTPDWTTVNDTQDACGSCHGVPPPAPHVQSASCGGCHPATAVGSTVAHPEKHINGTLEVSMLPACNACHGNDTNAAPPLDTTGGSATTLKTVGAHQAHLTAQSGLSSPVACATCHKVPTSAYDTGHLDAAPAEVSMTGLAAAGGATPTWSTGSATCSSTYCHGATLNAGGSVTTPLWTKVDDTQDACGACHGNPPPAPHVSMTNCGLCHAATASGGAIAHPEKHIDGTLDVALPSACDACHGSGANNAPPVDTNGASATTLKTVGAHQAHLLASSAIALPVTCDQCHVVPATTEAAGHLGAGPAELTFGALAKTGGANATWNEGAATCSTTYCHGATLNGGSNKTPLWTKVDNTQDACGTCHGLGPATGFHIDHHGALNCRECHNTVATTTAITGPALHINGVKDVSLRLGGTWSGTTKSCDPACHGAETW